MTVIHRILPLLAIVLGLCSCGEKGPKADEQGNYPPALTSSRTSPCETDEDCVVACIHDGWCCQEPCDCGTVYNQEEFLAVRQRHEQACKDWVYRCDSVDCAYSDYRDEPRCVRGRCNTEAVKKAMAEDPADREE